MIMRDDRFAQPDTLLIKPRPFQMAPSANYGRNGSTADPIIPTFTVACLAIMQERLKLNGSYAAKLVDGQQHAFAARFAAGYQWPEPEPEAEPLMLGRGCS
ncbi:hypothetical protein [Devosia chinhatensis]|uniref:Uncharacterized protein n=1 Tax=Devosia chinhatensis TaxID=429727 RepID=A0A0F5FKS4_9HYPH|nr:hypothetical protein [Devosia chinhatensis]KKB08812.1 hypothetical protein VE26_01705 [Devosia chinhatensis]